MDFTRAWQTIVQMVNGFIAALPNLVLACLIFIAGVFIARRMQAFVVHMTEKRHRARNLGILLGKLVQSAVIITGALIAATVLFPSFQLGDLIQLLGIGSIAIGFAFRDVFQNFLAGILLLLTVPFRIGDQIVVDAFEGTIEDIQTRATTIKTYDGRRIVIPNTDLFTQPVTVNTAFGRRRLECELGIGYQDDIAQTKALMLEAVQHIEGVLNEPPAEALVLTLQEQGVIIRLYWWTMLPQHMDILRLRDQVLTTLKNRLAERGIELFPTSPLVLKTLPSEQSAALNGVSATTETHSSSS